MIIRQLEKGDMPEVTSLITAMWMTHADTESGFLEKEYLEGINTHDYLVACLASDTNFMFVAEEDKKIVGCCRVEIRDAEPVLIEPKLAYLHDVIVHKDYQRQHVATALIETIEPFVEKELEIKLIKTRLYTFNSAAQGLFLKRGYTNLYSEYYKKLG